MKKPSKIIILDQIVHLFKDAENITNVNISLANRFVAKARRLSTKFKVPIPVLFKRRFCKHCGVFFVLGRNCRVRMNDKKIVYSCFNCKKFIRFPVSKTRVHLSF